MKNKRHQDNFAMDLYSLLMSDLKRSVNVNVDITNSLGLLPSHCQNMVSFSIKEQYACNTIGSWKKTWHIVDVEIPF